MRVGGARLTGMTATAYPTRPAVDCADRKFRADMMRLLRDAEKLDRDTRGAIGRWHDRTYAAEQRATARDPLGWRSAASAQRAKIADAVRDYGRECIRVNDAAHRADLERRLREARAEARAAAYARNDPWAPFYP